MSAINSSSSSSSCTAIVPYIPSTISEWMGKVVKQRQENQKYVLYLNVFNRASVPLFFRMSSFCSAIVPYADPRTLPAYFRSLLPKAKEPFPYLKSYFPFPSPRPFFTPGDPALQWKNEDDFRGALVFFYYSCLSNDTSMNSSCTGDKLFLYQWDVRKMNVKWFEIRNSSERITCKIIKKIEIVFFGKRFSNFSEVYRQEWIFSIVKDNIFTKEAYRLEGKNVIPERKFPVSYLDGKQFEVYNLKDSSVIQKDMWDNWKTTFVGASRAYNELIHPLVEVVFEKIGLASDQRGITVMDIGGSDGELALTLLEEYPFIEKMISVDISPEMTALAMTRKNCHCGFHTQWAKDRLEVFQGDVTKSPLTGFTKGKPVDVIVLCGVVARQVLSPEESWQLLTQCYTLLNKGGLVFITGFSPPIFNSDHYKKLGFKVLNSTISYYDPFEQREDGSVRFKRQECYLLKKKA